MEEHWVLPAGRCSRVAGLFSCWLHCCDAPVPSGAQQLLLGPHSIPFPNQGSHLTAAAGVGCYLSHLHPSPGIALDGRKVATTPGDGPWPTPTSPGSPSHHTPLPPYAPIPLVFLQFLHHGAWGSNPRNAPLLPSPG